MPSNSEYLEFLNKEIALFALEDPEFADAIRIATNAAMKSGKANDAIVAADEADNAIKATIDIPTLIKNADEANKEYKLALVVFLTKAAAYNS